MTYPISDVTRRVVYSGSLGAGPYPFTFEILAQGDVGVYKNTTLLTLTTDYTVTINADGTGSITLVSAATASDTISIFGNKGIQRQTDFTTGGDLFANSLNDELDAQTIFAQQNSEAISRSVRAPLTDPTTVDMVLPAKADRADKILQFDVDGNPDVVSTTEFVSGLSNAIVGANYVTNNATGDGSTTAFTVSTASGSKTNIDIYIDGVYQNKSTFNVSGTTVTFTEAPPLNSSIEFMIGYALLSAAGSSSIDFTQAGTGAVTRTVESKLQDVVSVTDFGAVGDGVTDDTAAIQAAIDSLPSNGGEVLLPSGTYYITTSLKVKTGVTLSGQSMTKSSIKVMDGVVGIERDTAESRSYRVTIRDLWIYGETASHASTLIKFNEIDDSTLQNVYLYRALVGVELSGSLGSTRNLFFNVHVANCDYGYDFNGLSNSAKILGGRLIEYTTYGVYVRSTTQSNNIVIDGVALESTQTSAIGVYSNSPSTSIMNCRFEQTGSSAIAYKFDASSSNGYAFANYFSISGGGSRRSISDPSDHQILDNDYVRVRQVSAKAWVRFSQSGGTVTVLDSYNVSGVVRNSTGSYTITFSNALSSGNWCGFSDTEYSGTGNVLISSINQQNAGNAVIATADTAGTLADPDNVSFVCYNSD